MPSTRRLTVALGPKTTTNILLTEPTEAKADNLFLTTWGSSFVLANHLHSITSIPAPASHFHRDAVTSTTIIPVLELGAGTGLVGLVAAQLWKTSVVLTDLTEIAPALGANIAINSSAAAMAMCAGVLDWREPEILTITGFPERLGDVEGEGSEKKVLKAAKCKAQIVMAADTVYDEAQPPMLVRTILAWLAAGDKSRVVLVYPLRIAYLDHIRDLWERLENAGLECIEEGRDEENNDESWDEPAPYEWCIWRWKTG